MLDIENIDKSYEIYIENLQPGVYVYIDKKEDKIRLKQPNDARYALTIPIDILKDLINNKLISVRGVTITSAGRVAVFDREPDPVDEDALKQFKAKVTQNKKERKEQKAQETVEALAAAASEAENRSQTTAPVINNSSQTSPRSVRQPGVRGVIQDIQELIQMFNRQQPNHSR